MFYSKDASPIRKNGDGSGLLPLSLDPKYLILPLLTGEGIWRIVVRLSENRHQSCDL